MGREEGLLHLHTDRFLLFPPHPPCARGLNLNRLTCPSTPFLSTSVLPRSLHSSLPLSPHLHAAHRAITASRYHTIAVSLHLFHYLSVPLPLLTHYSVLCVCVCEGITHPEAPFCTDIGMLWTLVLNSQASCGAAASQFSLQHLHTNVGAGGIMHVEMMCFSPACAPSVSGSAYMHFSI